MNPPHESKPSPGLRAVGIVLLVLGMSSTAQFIVRQIKGASQGHTYYEFIILGLILAVTGFALVARHVHRK